MKYIVSYIILGGIFLLMLYQNIYRPLQRKKLKGNGFEHSDAWILLSIIHTHGSKGASLEDLIRGADYINRTIPTISEIEGAINRFLEFGMIHIINEKFILAEDILRDYEAVCQKTKSYLEQWDLLEKIFMERHFERQEFTKYLITIDTYEESYKKYHKNFNKLVKRLERLEKK